MGRSLSSPFASPFAMPPVTKPVVLCVDDEKIILDSLYMQLTEALEDEFEIELAESAEEALEVIQELKAEKRQLAIIISDQIMPGKKGHELLREIHYDYPEVLKILLTGQASLGDVQHAINQASLYRYITKPWVESDLQLTVNEAARSFLQTRQLELFNTSNQLLRKLNEASQVLASETNPQILYQHFISNAVESTGSEQGYLLLNESGSMGLKSFSAQEKTHLKSIQERVEAAGEQAFVSELMQFVYAHANNRLPRHQLVYPLASIEHSVGYVILENPHTEAGFMELQAEILQMLVQQLNISLDMAQLYASLARKTEELEAEKQKLQFLADELEVKNNDVMDSIQYAYRIQESILPEVMSLESIFPDSFVLYKPRDVISGDFYWWKNRRDDFLLAAADCTGHGVPGAIMSVIGNNLLNRAAAKESLPTLAHMMAFMNQQLRLILKQSSYDDATTSAGTMDGMDMALIRYEPNQRKLEFAGAYRPMVVVRQGEVAEFTGSRASVGGNILEAVDDDMPYESYEVILEPGDCIYLFSDGYTDQFDSAGERKFGRKQLKEIIANISQAPMREQHMELTRHFLEWKGENDQTDDVLVIGLRVPRSTWQ